MTADVDFKIIKLIAEQKDKTITYGPLEQGEFLKRMGGDARLRALVQNATNPDDVKSLQSGYEMLTDPTKMGNRFKFFAMFPSVMREFHQKRPVNGFNSE